MSDLFYSKIKLTDGTGADHSYKPAAVLLISRYSDTVTVIKHEGDIYTQYIGETYSEALPLPSSKMADAFDTCGYILVFYHQVQVSVTTHHPFLLQPY